MSQSDKTRAIVLQTFRYGDESLITHLFTEDIGLQSFIIRGAYRRRAKIGAAFFQIMTPLVIVRASSKGEIGYLKEVSLEYPFKTITSDIVKNSVSLFMGELLQKSIIGTEKNEVLFSFIHHSLQNLDSADCIVNDVPLLFASGLCEILGFAPDTGTYREGFLFSLDEGSFCRGENIGNKFLGREESTAFANLFGKKVITMERRRLLSIMLAYYKIHVPGFREINSCEVLREILK